MKLDEAAIKWAIDHLSLYSDTDLFPRPIEYKIIKDNEDRTINVLKNIDLGNYEYSASRRFIVPKDEFSYRTATQLDPLDNIFLTAIIFKYGEQIESRRLGIEQKKIFSYRFAPQETGGLYNQDISWTQFWEECKEKASNYKYAVYLDIADFYNQIYHHTIEVQLRASGLPNQIIRWLENLLKHVTVKVSRGIPIGPHATNLLAELSMIPIDNSLSLKGFDFCRFVDDIVIFCNCYEEAKINIYQMADILDKQQRLMLQRQKTKIYESEKFILHCDAMIQDRPINKYEKEIIQVIRSHCGNNPYITVDVSKLTNDEIGLFTDELIEKIILEYLNEKEPNYIRLRWFIRRLAQVNVPSAIEFLITNINKLIPAISDVCHYLVSVRNNYTGNWVVLGEDILNALNKNIIKSNQYFQITLLNLFTRNEALNHIDKLISMYQISSSNIKRKILLSAFRAGAGDWIRELKESYFAMDIWSKRAFIIASKTLPLEERKFFLNHIQDRNILNGILINWAKN